MKTSEEGGRNCGFKSEYRPNHKFEMKDDSSFMFEIGEILFTDQPSIEPGETKVVTVRFLYHESIIRFINVGQKWFINEGPRTVGFGEIIEV